MIGFVYILINPYFADDVYKVGCTERAPLARAEELSKGTAIPAPFEVLCYMEVDNFQQAERELHAWLKNFRINDAREFFQGGIEHAVGWMWWHRGRHSFCALADTELYGEEMLTRIEFAGVFDGKEPSFYALPDPFETPGAPQPEVQLAVVDELAGPAAEDPPVDLKVVGGTES